MVVIVDPCGCLGDDPAYFIATLSKYVSHKATVHPYLLECVTIVYMRSTLCVQDGVNGGFGSVDVLLNAFYIVWSISWLLTQYGYRSHSFQTLESLDLSLDQIWVKCCDQGIDRCY